MTSDDEAVKLLKDANKEGKLLFVVANREVDVYDKIEGMRDSIKDDVIYCSIPPDEDVRFKLALKGYGHINAFGDKLPEPKVEEKKPYKSVTYSDAYYEPEAVEARRIEAEKKEAEKKMKEDMTSADKVTLLSLDWDYRKR